MSESIFMNEIGIVSSIKNESPYIDEWIKYHMAAGVTKFYLYDNESDDDLKDILNPYIEKNIVEYTFFPGKCAQMPIFNDAIKKHRFDCRYLAFIDIDEFIYPKSSDNILDAVKDIMEFDKSAGGIRVNWYMFGSSGQESMDLTRGVLERFLYRAEKTDENGKCIVNPRCVDFWQHAHNAYYYSGRYSINERGRRMGPDEKDQDGTADKIVIHHYHTKSKEEWVRKKKLGDVYYESNPYLNKDGTVKWEMFEQSDRNEVYDNDILNYFEKIKSNSASVKNDDAQFILKCLNKITELAEKDNVIVSMEEFLCYWHVCDKYMRKYLSEVTVSYFEEMLVKGLEKVLRNTHELWEFQLFLSVIPELIRTSSKTKPIIIKYSKQIIPQIMNIYSKWENYREYCKYKRQLEWLEII